MKTRWIGIVSGIACLTACDSPEKPVEKPSEPVVQAPPYPAEFFFVEAEDGRPTGETAGDPMASGSKSVLLASFKELVIAVPPSLKPLTVWLRHKGAPVAMKISGEGGIAALSDGFQEQYVWTSFGEMELGEEDRQIVFSGNGDASENSSIDCILFTGGNVEDKDGLLTALAPVSIGHASGEFRAAPAVWGINLISVNKTEFPSQAGADNLAHLSPGFIRIDADGLVDTENRKWDEDRIRKTTQSLLGLEGNADIMFSIADWPAWMDEDDDGFLDEGSKADYADLAGRFAEIIWEFPQARPRVFFEITNGQDKLYHSDQVAGKEPHRVAELGRIYLLAAERIRALAPGAKVGGASATDMANMDFHEQFIALTAPELDFYSIRFPAGDPAPRINAIRGILHKNSQGRSIPISLNESDGSAETLESFASRVLAAFAAGADSAAWNVGDSYRPAASHLTRILNTEFTGPCAILNTGGPDLLTVLGTEDGNRMLLLHRGARDRTLTLPEGQWTGWILENGSDNPREISATGTADLPGLSIVYLGR